MSVINKEDNNMLQAYSLNVEVPANSAIPFNNLTLEKGCTARLSSPSTIDLNKCGVYFVTCNGSVDASTKIQLYKDGVAMPQAQNTGATSVSFSTLVQVDKNNSCCACASPTTLQVIVEEAATFDDINIVVTKLI